MTRPKKPVKAEELGLRLGERIAKYRKGHGMTQAAFAEIIDVDSETISRFERGTALPSLLRLFEIAQALHIGVSDLLAEDGAGVFDDVEPGDQELLRQIAGLMKKRRSKKK